MNIKSDGYSNAIYLSPSHLCSFGSGFEIIIHDNCTKDYLNSSYLGLTY
jgi:hypothetical protein